MAGAISTVRAWRKLTPSAMSPSVLSNMATLAETSLQTTHYHGEKRRWNFEKYVSTHVNQHTILHGLEAHGYAGLDERSELRHLIAGIKTPQFDSVKTQILASAALRSDFAACVTL